MDLKPGVEPDIAEQPQSVDITVPGGSIRLQALAPIGHHVTLQGANVGSRNSCKGKAVPVTRRGGQ